MNLNEEIIQEFMKAFYEGRMNPNQQQGPQKQKMNYSNNNQNNYARGEDFMRQQGFRKDPFSHEYEDYKAYESRKEEELKRQREYERLQKEKQASFFFLLKTIRFPFFLFKKKKQTKKSIFENISNNYICFIRKSS